MWRFVHLTDPHLASQRDGEWNNRFLCSMMPEVMACLATDLKTVAPDFILATGDIVSKQTREAMFEARDMMDALGIPYYPMGGNHDFVLQDSRAWFLEAFSHRIPSANTVYSFTHKDLHVCVLDAWWLWADGTISPVSERTIAANIDNGLKGQRWAIPPEQFVWLENDLKVHATEKTIVAVHYPMVPIPDRMRRPGFQNGGCLNNGNLLQGLLERHPQVKAVFSGHVHLHFIERLNGLTQVVTAALPEFPTEYRIVDVHPDRLEITTRTLSDPQFAQRSLIPGKDWTAGTPADRTATIPLS